MRSIKLMLVLFIVLFDKVCHGILHLPWNCEDVYKHMNWNLLENEDYCGTYDLSEPYTDEYYAPDPQESEPPPPSTDGHDGDEGRPVSDRILRGIETRKNEYPWMAQLIWRKFLDNAPYCGGTIISNHYVLTAAHCVVTISRNGTIERRAADEFTIRLGAHNRENKCDGDGICRDFEEFEVEEIVIPDENRVDNNSKVLDNDIALIRLKNASAFVGGIISPICLPKCSMLNQLMYGNKMVFAGWGATSQEMSGPNLTYPKALMKFYPLVKPTSRCSYHRYDRDRMVCTEELKKKSSTCDGDGGGPLMLLTKEMKDRRLTSIYYQIGILSFGTGNCDASLLPHEKDSIYTRVAYHMPWIVAHVKE